MGGSGTGSAAEYFGVIPDLVTTAKGLTSGTVPMGAVMARKHIYDAIVHGRGAGAEKAIELFHGYTYSAHPLACAAALATFETYREERLFERAQRAGALLGGAAPFLARPAARHRHPQYRPDGCGRPRARDRASPASAPTTPCSLGCEKGVMLRITGDTLAMSPPLIVTRDADRRDGGASRRGAGRGRLRPDEAIGVRTSCASDH